MTQSESASAKAMHECTGKHIKISQILSGESIRQLSSVSYISKPMFAHFGFDVQDETDNVGGNDGNYCEADL